MVLNYDVLVHIAKLLADEQEWRTLVAFSLINSMFNQAASKVLYHTVVVSPTKSKTLDLSKRGQLLPKQFVSAQLEHNTLCVVQLEISGFLSTRPPPFNDFSDVLASAILLWPNLQSVILTPREYRDDVFTKALDALLTRRYLRCLAVNASCCDDVRTSLLVQLSALEMVVIENPPRAILHALPGWLTRMRNSLRTFLLKDNCGSVTPNVLKLFLPAASNVTSFGLGLSYSLTNDDVFTFLSQLTRLSALVIRYYQQQRVPLVRPNLTSLRYLKVIHSNVTTRPEARYLCNWLRRLVADSPIDTLCLVPECRRTAPDISLDSFAEHLTHKHFRTLRVLRIEHAFVGLKVLQKLCAQCVLLEELGVRTNRAILDQSDQILRHCSKLHTLIVSTANSKRSSVSIDESAIRAFMQNGHSALRRVSINGRHWVGYWVTMDDSEVVFNVDETE